MAYEKLMQQENFMDFDDQKLRPYILLNENQLLLQIGITVVNRGD
jgi:superfamily I DNA/RNA helicase